MIEECDDLNFNLALFRSLVGGRVSLGTSKASEYVTTLEERIAIIGCYLLHFDKTTHKHTRHHCLCTHSHSLTHRPHFDTMTVTVIVFENLYSLALVLSASYKKGGRYRYTHDVFQNEKRNVGTTNI